MRDKIAKASLLAGAKKYHLERLNELVEAYNDTPQAALKPSQGEVRENGGPLYTGYTRTFTPKEAKLVSFRNMNALFDK